MEKRGYQIDLVYVRDDKVYTLCEVKYLQSKVTPKIIENILRINKSIKCFGDKKTEFAFPYYNVNCIGFIFFLERFH